MAKTVTDDAEAPAGELPGASVVNTPDPELLDEAGQVRNPDMVDGESVGSHLEPPDEVVQAPNPQARQAPPDPDNKPEERASSVGDDAREQIAKNYQAQRDADVAADIEADPEGMAILAEQAGTPLPEGTPTPAADTETPAGEAPPVTPEGADAPGTVIQMFGVEIDPHATEEITVYGKVQKVTATELFQIGKETVQKERSADFRMAKAVEYEGTLNAYKDRLNAARDNLLKGRNLDGSAISPPSGAVETPTGTGDLPKGGTPPAGEVRAQVETATKAYSDALLQGKVDDANTILTSLITENMGRTATPPVSVDEVVEKATERLRVERKADEAKDAASVANKFFTESYPEIAGNPLWIVSATEYQRQLRSNPENARFSDLELAKATGEHVRSQLKQSAEGGPTPPAITPTSTAQPDKVKDDLEARRVLKAKTPRPPVPSTPSERHAPAPSGDLYPSGSTYIQQMRDIRGYHPS